MERIDTAYSMLLWVSTIFLSIMLCVCLIRAILGPRFTDRIVSINVICTKAIIMIAILSSLFKDSNLLDIAIVYAMIAFLVVVVLSKCYIMPYHANPAELDIDPAIVDSVNKNREEDTR